MPRKSSRVSVVTILAVIAILAIHAGAATEKVLYTFHGPGDGSLPMSNLILDKAGNIYGTASAGGSAACESFYGIAGCGTVFELSPNSNGTWTETVLYSFQGGLDGIGPGNIVFDKAGNIYGTTSGGGISTCFGGCGTVFKLSRSHGVWVETVLYRFQGAADGDLPTGIILDALGNVYGATYQGGDFTCSTAPKGCGVIYELSPSASGVWSQTVLHTFGTYDGRNPNGGLVFDRRGNLYGSTQGGGPGTLFELSPGTNGWTETTLYNFDGVAGNLPMGGVVSGRAGRLFGATFNGGGGWGTFFEAASTPTGWTAVAIQTFGGNEASGLTPVGLLSTDSAKNIYGTTEYGDVTGASYGTVYKMTPTSTGGWSGTILYAFTGGADGGVPAASVTVDSAGNVYGSTLVGGLGNCDPYYGSGCGVVFEITP